MENLEAFFKKKKINHQAFALENPVIWQQLNHEYEILGPNGFDQRKKFAINDWRLLYPITSDS